MVKGDPCIQVVMTHGNFKIDRLEYYSEYSKEECSFLKQSRRVNNPVQRIERTCKKKGLYFKGYEYAIYRVVKGDSEKGKFNDFLVLKRANVFKSLDDLPEGFRARVAEVILLHGK